MTQSLTKPNLKELEEALGRDKNLVLFYTAWVKNGLNATKAYKELHPNVDDHSARTLGSRQLAKVDISAILARINLAEMFRTIFSVQPTSRKSF